MRTLNTLLSQDGRTPTNLVCSDCPDLASLISTISLLCSASLQHRHAHQDKSSNLIEDGPERDKLLPEGNSPRDNRLLAAVA